ncbi:hypothetical protein GCM10010401_14270 [Rarobacter faecitabidus]|uniref:Uncharacterized protein n=1 Tax=Rarobacter faecitabidus TaxID=13243 RepID=A0A542ZDV6_RARFA|nr:hypothetical protein [Rarobacter faecitabidus]TQL58526.1 hypothetical protein FB461_1941 [Rarobacter faecitabidus]
MTFYIGPLGGLVAVEGVQPEVPITPSRGVEETQMDDGSLMIRDTPFAPRRWSLQLRPWMPAREARVLQAAAGRLLGDVWLFDDSLARENMVHLHQVAGSDVDGFGRVDCHGLWLRSFVPGANSSRSVTREARYATVDSQAPYQVGPNLCRIDATSSLLARIALPFLPAGAAFLDASLKLLPSISGALTGGTVRRTGAGWSPDLVAFNNAPDLAGAPIGSLPATFGNAEITIPISLDVTDFGTDVNLALTATSGGLHSNYGPVLVVNYTLAEGEDAVRQVLVRGARPVNVSVFTDAGPAAVVGSVAGPGVAAPLTAGADGRAEVTVTPSSDGVLVVTLAGGAQPGLVSGLQVVEGFEPPDLFVPGRGAWARVHVSDPGQVLQIAEAGRDALSDWTVEFVEIGRPGDVP